MSTDTKSILMVMVCNWCAQYTIQDAQSYTRSVDQLYNTITKTINRLHIVRVILQYRLATQISIDTKWLLKGRPGLDDLVTN